MSRKLVIVESPTKARTITRFLGGEARVVASMGHVRDLPENSLGVDVGHGFKPAYVMTSGGRKVIDDLKRGIGSVADIYLATDPDREGEAIAWHLQQALAPFTTAQFHRVTFHEITRDAIQQAFATPGELDLPRVDAQQARRVLDRLVGYQVSPLLWKNIRKGTSAGRVQSVALRLVCERQREIDGFTPVEYWTFDADFHSPSPEALFTARLSQLDGRRLPFDGKAALIPDAAAANAMAAELAAASGFRVSRVASTPKQQRAPAPFITSTLQQAAGTNLNLGSGLTMRIAQELYEGVEIGEEGPTGLITYMRTDSVEIAKEAQEAARQFIGTTFGADYIPERPNVYRSRQSAQAAHEAIRPTDVTRTPDRMASFLSPNQLRLYRLIWTRFVASQMAPARLLENSIEVTAEGAALTHAYLFRAATSSLVFPGFKKVYLFKETESTRATSRDEEDEDEPRNNDLPQLPEGTGCDLRELKKAQKFTEPPRPYSEATLVKELEQNGIGRPSTYAATVETILGRDYVKKDKGRLAPTALGFNVNDFLVARLPQLFDVGFTASMETLLDEVEEGKVNWTAMIEDFYGKFREWSGTAAPLNAPANDRILRFLEQFPADLPWNPPVKRGRRTFDDHKFHESLIEQARGSKPISDKQWQAILGLAALYAAHLPGMPAAAAELGVAADLEAAVQRLAEEKAAPPPAAATGPDSKPLLEALTAVKWDPPGRRAGKTFDDRKFHASLSRQVEDGKPLTPAQLNALKRLALRYRNQIPDFLDLSARFEIELPQAVTDDEERPRELRVPALLELLAHIKTWVPPAGTGPRAFDDQRFANSIKDQYLRRGTLSPRQVEAIKKLVVKYREQVPDFDEASARLGLTIPAPARKLDAKCPDCGEPMMERRRGNRVFYGCSAYPKCRHTASSLPTPDAP
ncbi:MAG: type I DNA topoisomerase [Lentisphaeria bacterium]